MKTVSMQLVTVELENGHRGVFIGAPLVTDERADADCQRSGFRTFRMSLMKSP